MSRHNFLQPTSRYELNIGQFEIILSKVNLNESEILKVHKTEKCHSKFEVKRAYKSSLSSVTMQACYNLLYKVNAK